MQHHLFCISIVCIVKKICIESRILHKQLPKTIFSDGLLINKAKLRVGGRRVELDLHKNWVFFYEFYVRFYTIHSACGGVTRAFFEGVIRLPVSLNIVNILIIIFNGLQHTQPLESGRFRTTPTLGSQLTIILFLYWLHLRHPSNMFHTMSHVSKLIFLYFCIVGDE